MNKPVQKRTLETRARLIDAAQQIIAQHGYAALRVEQVVQGAGVAKGTFFAHFPDKDALMELIIGNEMDAHLDALEKLPAPTSVQALVQSMLPFMRFMVRERYVFDLIVRHSGAAAKEEIGPIATNFERQVQSLAPWLAEGPFRNDVPPQLLAEGIQAFAIQSMALHFCVINNARPMQDRFTDYMQAWLMPPA